MRKTTHPSRDIIESLGVELRGKFIVHCITGSVAAVQSPEIARLLMRHGAEVVAVFSEAAHIIIHPYLMEWATGNPVVVELTGQIEHVDLAGKHDEHVDLYLIAPATANTIGKIANGIDDTPVYTVTIHPDDSNIIYAGTVNKGLLRSTDGGESWQHFALDGTHIWELEIK